MTHGSRLIFVLLAALGVQGQLLPGFRIASEHRVPGFISSIAVDSKGILYATTTDGWIHRVEGSESVPVAALPTRSGGNGGLLGMALLDDETAVVHYTTWSGERVLDDVISKVDLGTGAETVLEAFVCDIEFRSRGVSDEHHGGNLTVAPDGSIYVGIGDYGGFAIAQLPQWNAGKIWKLDAQGNATQYAQGLRNPYDLAWDPELSRVVVADNGEEGGDELHVVASGDDCGWPNAKKGIAPVYVFPTTVAPTGLARLSGANPLLRRGYLATAFVTKSLYYFPGVTAPVADPVAIVTNDDEFLIDVIEGVDGAIYLAAATFARGSFVQRLEVPRPGDCNGDGLTDREDITPTVREIEDGDAHATITAQGGSYPGSWGCDANADAVIDARDLEALVRMVKPRRRAVRP
jgi:hypothetical protein